MLFGYDSLVKIEGDQNYPFPNGYNKGYINNLIDEYTYTNLCSYDVYHFLFKNDIKFNRWDFGYDSVENLIKTDKYFVYPILLKHKEDFEGLVHKYKFVISDNVINSVKNKKCKILLAYLLEGDFYTKEDIDHINNFIKEYEFDNKDVIFLTNNLKINEIVSSYEVNFTIITFNYFLSNPWFIKYDLLNPSNEPIIKIDLDKKMDFIINYPKIKKFLCLNRRPSEHRVILFTELMKNTEISKNSIISLGSKKLFGFEKYNYDFINIYNNLVSSDFKYDKESGLNFLLSYNSNEDCIVDANPNFNLAFNLNETVHLNTFVNVVTETLFNNDTIFLSEKIWKPIYCCQPFIVFGNPGTLKELKKLGFKTFSDYWDESYDDEIDVSKKLEKIIDVINFINQKSYDELFEMTKRMSNDLRYNYQNFISKSENEVLELKSKINERFRR